MKKRDANMVLERLDILPGSKREKEEEHKKGERFGNAEKKWMEVRKKSTEVVEADRAWDP